MKRKQIYISEEIEGAVKDLAVLRGVPEAVIIREAMEQYLKKYEHKMLKKENPLRKLIGLFTDGPKDSSVNHDHYLYGAPKKK